MRCLLSLSSFLRINFLLSLDQVLWWYLFRSENIRTANNLSEYVNKCIYDESGPTDYSVMLHQQKLSIIKFNYLVFYIYILCSGSWCWETHTHTRMWNQIRNFQIWSWSGIVEWNSFLSVFVMASFIQSLSLFVWFCLTIREGGVQNVDIKFNWWWFQLK